MGRVGYLYESVKDQLKWKKLEVKRYVGVIMKIGQVVSLSDEDYRANCPLSPKISDLKGKELEAFVFNAI